MKKNIISTIIICIGTSSIVAASYGVKTIIYEKETRTPTTEEIYITDLSQKSIQTQLTIGMGNTTIERSNDKVDMLEKIERLALSNIVKNIELSQNREKELEKYLKESNDVLIESSFIVGNLKQELYFLKGELDNCLAEKNISDKNYYIGLKNHDKKTMEEAILESQKYGECASTNRIRFNADREILERIEYYYLVLSKKSIYLSSKEWLIIKHFDVLKDNIMAELDAKMVLENIGQ